MTSGRLLIVFHWNLFCSTCRVLSSPVLAVAVSSARPPDRGIQRVISSLMANSSQPWLVLLQSHQDGPVSSTRLAAWYRLAEASKVPADHVISMSVA